MFGTWDYRDFPTFPAKGLFFTHAIIQISQIKAKKQYDHRRTRSIDRKEVLG